MNSNAMHDTYHVCFYREQIRKRYTFYDLGVTVTQLLLYEANKAINTPVERCYFGFYF